MSNLFNFLSNNVKGLGSKSKRQKNFQRLKDLIKKQGNHFYSRISFKQRGRRNLEG